MRLEKTASGAWEPTGRRQPVEHIAVRVHACHIVARGQWRLLRRLFLLGAAERCVPLARSLRWLRRLLRAGREDTIGSNEGMESANGVAVLEQVALQGRAGGGGARGDAELAVDGRDVVVDGARADHQLCSDLRIAPALGEQA